ncbi:MAG: TRAP transporter small permease subunit [Synergistaceae bacterium]|nr:TRAP transporter small permease subunit [Synergistaceae bacterium]
MRKAVGVKMANGSVKGGSPLRRFLAVMYRIQSFFCICLVLSTASLVVIQVFMRYVLKSPLMGIEELLLFPAIWTYMLGGANASIERTHIECGIMTLYIKRPLTKSLFNLGKYAISAGICSWLLYWAYWYFEYAMRVKKTSAILHIPMVIAQSSLFICLLLMLIYALVGCYDYICEIRSGKTTQEEGVSC